MKKLFVIILTAAVTGLFAQGRDQKATDILDAVIEKTNSYDNFMAEFNYVMINEAAGINESKEGSITVSGDKYRLNIAGQVVISDGENIWTVLADDGEVMINTLEEGDESVTPSNLLDKYNLKYKSKYKGEIDYNGRTAQLIELKPEEGKTYSKIEVLIDKEKDQILSFTIYDRNQSSYSYEIIKFEPDVDVTDTTFRFVEKNYPGIDVIDMR